MDQKYLPLKEELETILRGVNPQNIVPYDTKSGDFLPINYTVNCFFNPGDLKAIMQMISRLQLSDPNQIYYLEEQLHITLLGQINIESDADKIIEVVDRFIKSNDISFDLFGVGSSVKVASVTAYPHFEIANLRNNLRNIGGGTKFDGPYEKLTWVNFMRYTEKVNPGLLESIRSEVNTNFGTVKPSKIQLLKNSSRLLVGAEVVHDFI